MTTIWQTSYMQEDLHNEINTNVVNNKQQQNYRHNHLSLPPAPTIDSCPLPHTSFSPFYLSDANLIPPPPSWFLLTGSASLLGFFK